MSRINTAAEARDMLLSRARPEIKSLAERMSALNAVYVSSARDTQFQEELNLVLADMLDPNATSGYAITVLGPPGAGKTRLVNRRLDKTPELLPFPDGFGNIASFCLKVQTPSACNVKTLGTAILRATGYPLVKTPNEDEIWGIVRERLRAKWHRIIFLDEFQHTLKGPKAKGAAHLANQVKLLMQDPEWPVWLVIAGVPDVMKFVTDDVWYQMERRIRPIRMDDLENTANDIQNTRVIVEALAKAGGLQVAFPIPDLFVRRLMHGALWRFGMTVQLIKMSIEVAFQDPEGNNELRMDHFIGGYRRLSSCSPQTNVFTAENWPEIRRQLVAAGKESQTYKLID